MVYDQAISKSILSLAGSTALQQSIMNLGMGILMVQGRRAGLILLALMSWLHLAQPLRSIP
ncbi:hypothetical protein LDE03_02430 [Lactobacillus delbrueckii subsp. delbrueckii]|nr:hypothetical protein LDE01_08950 [Lactobacillus delbrueckii subsp. delbrueckii]GEA74435.1 hypothetical protein LDE03_02430 [Lactobacillus delbrueckii subsp. delbrueckii]